MSYSLAYVMALVLQVFILMHHLPQASLGTISAQVQTEWALGGWRLVNRNNGE